MPKTIKCGAEKTRKERQDAYFRRQIDQLMVCMGVRSKTKVEDAAGFGRNKLYRLYRDPGKMKIEDAMRLEALFERYGMRLWMLEGGAANAG